MASAAQAPLAVVAPRLRPGERDRTDLLAARDERHRDRGVRIEDRHDPKVVVVDDGVIEPVADELLEDDRSAFAQSARRRLR